MKSCRRAGLYDPPVARAHPRNSRAVWNTRLVPSQREAHAAASPIALVSPVDVDFGHSFDVRNDDSALSP